VLVWSYSAPQKLSAIAASTLANPANQVSVSAASLWEIAIKISLGKNVGEFGQQQQFVARALQRFPRLCRFPKDDFGRKRDDALAPILRFSHTIGMRSPPPLPLRNLAARRSSVVRGACVGMGAAAGRAVGRKYEYSFAERRERIGFLFRGIGDAERQDRGLG
jgi:hypothetical protein